MSSLYIIDKQILACIDPETGEIIDPEALNALQMERDAKVENVALWIKNLESDISAYKAEKKAFQKRAEEAERKVDSLKKWLAQALNGQKFSTTKCAVNFRQTQSVDVQDIKFVPAEFLRVKREIEPDKAAIKDAIKKGREISGCTLVTKYSTQIR